MQIKGSGPLNAKIVLVSDHPGYPEKAMQKPIAGINENMLKQWWMKHGIYRNDIRVENLHEYIPPGMKIEAVPVDTLINSIQDFHHRMSKLKPNVIVPMGEYSVFAMTGKGKVKAQLRKAYGEGDMSATLAEKKAGVKVLRGSTYLYNGIKVIPTIHPKDVNIFEKWKARTIRDWGIIIEESKTKGYKPIEKLHISNPTQIELEKFYDQISQDGGRMALDIETWGKSISCVGFAYDKNVSYTLPTITKEDQEFYWPWIKALCGHRIPKVLQNGLYDWYWLDSVGINITNYKYDTMAMHHALNPIESHDLAFLASYYTRNNYWKDEAKDAEEIKKYASDLSALWTYNGLDCCITRELCDILERKLVSRGSMAFYLRHYAEMYNPLLHLMRHGVRVDSKKQKNWSSKLLRRAKRIREELAEVAGEDLYAVKGFSPVKLKRFLYETLKLPKQKKMFKRKAGKVRDTTIDVNAIKRLTVRYPKKIKGYGLQILKVRSLNKKASVLKKGWDKDGRIRCTYKLTTEQGRLSSSKNSMGRGYNLQNIEGERGGIRTTFLPDEGCIFVRVDLSQSEDRFCKMYTQSPRMVEQANLRPSEWDSHIENARIIFKTDKIDEQLRKIGKMAVHASQRAMTGKTLSDRLITKMDLVRTPKQCQAMIDNYLKVNQEIPNIYFPFVRTQIINGGILGNTWGRIIDFRDYTIDHNIYRKGYSFYLQSENADLLNQRGVIFFYRLKKDHQLKSEMNLQVHDEVIISCPPDEAYFVSKSLVESLETPRRIMGNMLRVPANLTIGTTWDSKDCYEFAELPGEDEFNEKIKEMMC